MSKLVNKYGEVWGYVRVSTKEQVTDRQVIALDEYGVDKSHIFIDKVSGKTFNRPAYKKLIRVLRKGDIIVVKSIDRLGRNYQEIIDQWRMITQDLGCGIHVIDMPILRVGGDPTDLISRFITDITLQVLSFVAQNERENTISRQKEGIEAAKRRRTVKVGRPKKRMPFDFYAIYLMWKTKEYGTNDLFRYCHEVWGMSNRTFYRRIHELDERFAYMSTDRILKLIFTDEETMLGFDYDTERIELGLGIYSHYVLNNRPKIERERANKKRREEELGIVSLTALEKEENRLKADILARRKEDFEKRFSPIDMSYFKEEFMDPNRDENGFYMLKRKPKKRTRNVDAHSKNSGFEQAVILIDPTPIIPLCSRDEILSPVKTVIVR